ncbi:hypothetical protein GIB67_039137 [Kingdonia uniflora]|uniref:Uncharacterized protein n=1 Tax=Kingdonia uniflora TaxID=39325 RepID=A0A7J7MLP8_9MAGN|nr:hypothetical protein GIB67_039137 [Kingdonia uniflora]
MKYVFKGFINISPTNLWRREISVYAHGGVDFSNNLLAELPSSLGKCLNLSELKASNNCITRLPEELVNCSKLLKLEVEGNKLTMLCENEIVSWTMLTELNVSKNLLSSIPDNLGVMSRLIRLDLHQNNICHTTLTLTLDFRNNMLSSLPAEIGELSRLGTLDLHSNQVVFPPAKGYEFETDEEEEEQDWGDEDGCEEEEEGKSWIECEANRLQGYYGEEEDYEDVGFGVAILSQVREPSSQIHDFFSQDRVISSQGQEGLMCGSFVKINQTLDSFTFGLKASRTIGRGDDDWFVEDTKMDVFDAGDGSRKRKRKRNGDNNFGNCVIGATGSTLDPGIIPQQDYRNYEVRLTNQRGGITEVSVLPATEKSFPKSIISSKYAAEVTLNAYLELTRTIEILGTRWAFLGPLHTNMGGKKEYNHDKGERPTPATKSYPSPTYSRTEVTRKEQTFLVTAKPFSSLARNKPQQGQASCRRRTPSNATTDNREGMHLLHFLREGAWFSVERVKSKYGTEETSSLPNTQTLMELDFAKIYLTLGSCSEKKFRGIYRDGFGRNVVIGGVAVGSCLLENGSKWCSPVKNVVLKAVYALGREAMIVQRAKALVKEGWTLMARCKPVLDILKYKEIDVELLCTKMWVSLSKINVPDELLDSFVGLERKSKTLLLSRRRNLEEVEKGKLRRKGRNCEPSEVVTRNRHVGSISSFAVANCSYFETSAKFSSPLRTVQSLIDFLSTIGREEISLLIERAKLAKERNVEATRLHGTETDVDQSPQSSGRDGDGDGQGDVGDSRHAGFGEGKETTEILRFKRKYGIPKDVRLEKYAYEMDDQNEPLGGILMHREQIRKGLKLPLRADQKKLLNFFNVAPGQFNPNVYDLFRVCGALNGQLTKRGGALITVDDICVYYTLRVIPARVGYQYLARFLKRPLFYDMVSTGGKYCDERLLVTGNYEFDVKDPGEPLRRKAFHLGTRGLNEQLYNLRKGYTGRIDELVANQEDLGVLFEEAGVKRLRTTGAEVLTIDGKMSAQNKRNSDVSLPLENQLLSGYMTDTNSEIEAFCNVPSRKGSKMRVAPSDAVTDLQDPKRPSRKSGTAEGQKVLTRSSVDKPPLGSVSGTSKKDVVVSKKKGVDDSDPKYVVQSEGEVTANLDSVAVGLALLGDRLEDCMVNLESLISFFGDGQSSLKKVRNLSCLPRFMKLVPDMNTSFMKLLQIKKIIVEARPRILSAGDIANQLKGYQIIEKDLTEEKERLIREKEKLNSTLNRYKLDADKSKKAAVAAARKEKDEEIAKLKEDSEVVRKTALEERNNAMENLRQEYLVKFVNLRKKLDEDYEDERSRKEFYKNIVKENMLPFMDSEDESVVDSPNVEEEREVVEEPIFTIPAGVETEVLFNELPDNVVGEESVADLLME